MATSTFAVNEEWTADSAPQVTIVEAVAGSQRRRWLEGRLQSIAKLGARTFVISCDFDLGGPWAGVNELFSALFEEMRMQRPDLTEHHARELVNVIPELKRVLTVRNPSLTDNATPEEKVRSYPADRAFRVVHGLINLLDSWKNETEKIPWVIACDHYDGAGTMSSKFFQELLRRRGRQLRIFLLVAVDCGKATEAQASFGDPLFTKVVTPSLACDPPTSPDIASAARFAGDLEQRSIGDRTEMQMNLPNLIRLWQLAGRPDRAIRWRAFGLELCNALGIYADALRYGNGILGLAAQHMPEDENLRWIILIKLLNCHVCLQDVKGALELAEGAGLELAQGSSDKLGLIYYSIAMLYARHRKPRNLEKGEEYLDRGLAEIEKANMPEPDFHFNSVFNRNGLAMIRNFQGRHQEAIELCRDGLERLNTHLSTELHRLHRSVLIYNIAQVYSAIGRDCEALEYYTAAISMDPNYSEYYNERGNIFLRLGELDKAHADYLNAIDLSSPYFEVCTNLGQCCRRRGAMAEAIRWYSQSLDLQPDHLLAWLGRAKAYEESGNTEAAIADYNVALTIQPDEWEAIASRGAIYYEAGNLHAALADFNRAVDLKPDQADLHQNRAIVLTDLGRYREAASDLEAALKLNPGEEDKVSLLARLEIVRQAELRAEGRSL